MTNSLLTPEISNFIRSLPWPKKLKWDVVEYETHLSLCFYRDNFITLTREEQYVVVPLVAEVMEKVNKLGIPINFKRFESSYGGPHGKGTVN